MGKFSYNKAVVSACARHIEGLYLGEPTGHDWWHTKRVWALAKKIAKGESGKNPDSYVVELAAILHDIADYKMNSGDDSIGPLKANALLESLGAEKEVREKVSRIISEMNFPGTAGKVKRMSSLEGEIVRDADFLDALGAIGIARTFAYGGKKGRPIYDPNVKLKFSMTKEEYRARGATHTINHFHEKLLRLRGMLFTKTAKKIAERREKVMVRFLSDFMNEWKGQG